MSDIHFSNYKLEENKYYFLYIGELKNYGLNRFLQEALSRIENRNFDFISIVPDVFEQYNYKNLIVINPETKNYSCKPGGKVSCRIPAQEITPISKEAFKQISKRVSAVLNQAVLLRGVNNSFVKMWKLCETIQESYVRPYYIFNCSYRNPQFAHIRVPVEKGRDIAESMYGNISGDAIPRYIATAGGKIPLHRSNVIGRDGADLILMKPWSQEAVRYPDANPDEYDRPDFSFTKQG
jgi:hypothetical protein